MAAINTTTTMTGLFKEVYGTSVIELQKFAAKLASRIPFTEAEMIGNKYHQPVDLTLENGFTYAAAGATTPTLLAANVGQMGDAQIDGAQLYGRSVINYEAMFKAATAGKKAFASATKHVVKRLSTSGVKRLEIQMMHGQRGVGTLASVSGTGTTRAWVVTAASWSPGIWAGLVGGTLDVFAADYSGSKINSNAQVVITSVVPETRTVNVSGNATDLTNTTAGMQLFFETGSPSSEMAGLDVILRNAGTLFNINAASYELWGGNVTSSVGSLTMAKVLSAVGTTASYGNDNDVLAVVSPARFETLNAEQSALRDYDVSYIKGGNEAENGFRTIKYKGQTGIIEIMAHPLQKDGLVHVFPPNEAHRIGATDLTFVKRHGTDETLILETANQASAEMRVYANQAIFLEAPRHGAVLDGVTA